MSLNRVFAFAAIGLLGCGGQIDPSADEGAPEDVEAVDSVSQAATSVGTKPFNSANFKWLSAGHFKNGAGNCAYRSGTLLGMAPCDGTTAGLTYSNQHFSIYQQKKTGALHICERDGLELHTEYQTCTRKYYSGSTLVSTKAELCTLHAYSGRNCLVGTLSSSGAVSDVRVYSGYALGRNFIDFGYGVYQNVVDGVTQWNEPGFFELNRLNFDRLSDNSYRFRADQSKFLTAKPAPNNIVIPAAKPATWGLSSQTWLNVP